MARHRAIASSTVGRGRAAAQQSSWGAAAVLKGWYTVDQDGVLYAGPLLGWEIEGDLSVATVSGMQVAFWLRIATEERHLQAARHSETQHRVDGLLAGFVGNLLHGLGDILAQRRVPASGASGSAQRPSAAAEQIGTRAFQLPGA